MAMTPLTIRLISRPQELFPNNSSSRNAGLRTRFPFAWFQVQAQVNGQANNTSENRLVAVGVNGPADASTQIDYTIDAKLTHVGSKSLILSTWESDGELEPTYSLASYTAVNSTTVKPHVLNGTTEEYVSIYKIEIKGTWGADTYNEGPGRLAANTEHYELSFAKSGSNATDTKFWVLADNDETPSAVAKSDEDDQTSEATVLKKNVKDVGTSYAVIGYLYVRMEGGATTGTVDTSHSGSLSVTLTGTGSIQTGLLP
ncbi:MAG: hypothetical protein IJU64_07090 [Bacilli bacterium]|nr:hypothetical protein [Bacilli bacterium]